jgi:hypothetical protein
LDFSPLPVSPTAYALVEEMAVTAFSWSPPPVPGVGLGTTLQLVPFQCWIRV